MLDVTKEFIEDFDTMPKEAQIRFANRYSLDQIQALHECGGYSFAMSNGRIVDVEKEEPPMGQSKG